MSPLSTKCLERKYTQEGGYEIFTWKIPLCKTGISTESKRINASICGKNA